MATNNQTPNAASIDLTKLVGDISKASGRPFEQVAQEIVADTAVQVAQLASQYAPRRTGKLAGSMTIRISNNGMTAEVYPDVSYAAYVEYGTRPHIIRPVKAKALHFQVQGKDVYASVVHHPGTKPQPFMRPAAERVATAMASQLGNSAVKFITEGDSGYSSH